MKAVIKETSDFKVIVEEEVIVKVLGIIIEELRREMDEINLAETIGGVKLTK
tara:strand:+ start:809 stop:964 length:156 start_codon:yes stop_codon:yes gene_type:complete